MSLTSEDVARIAHLARLALTEDELAHYGEQLSAILDYAARLEELDLTGIAPSAHGARRNVLRDDEVRPSLPVEDTLFNAAAVADNQFLIQPVLEE
jgi:aspartyl-tRNA(Asn)/glutamyl-tRNA(Gln) amidotransferase subunit C